MTFARHPSVPQMCTYSYSGENLTCMIQQPRALLEEMSQKDTHKRKFVVEHIKSCTCVTNQLLVRLGIYKRIDFGE